MEALNTRRRQGVFSAIERFLTSAFEGTTARIFDLRLQPVSLAKAAIRAMEAHVLVGVKDRVAPNRYEFALSKQDFASIEPFHQELQAELAEAISLAAEQRHLKLIGPVIVRIDGASDVRNHRVEVRCAFVGARQGGHGRMTRPVRTKLIGEATTALSRAGAFLEREGSASRIQLDKAKVTIGRARTCSIVVDDEHVSRRHAEIRRRSGVYTVIDLGSTNGTAVNGQAITESVLGDGDRIRVGPAAFVYHAVTSETTGAE